MKFWHKDLIPYLPDDLLSEQWKICLSFSWKVIKGLDVSNSSEQKVLAYRGEHFYRYATLVYKEMYDRDLKANFDVFERRWKCKHYKIQRKDLFWKWHNDRYLNQCYSELEFLKDMELIDEEEWLTINAGVYTIMAERLGRRYGRQ